jgi:hypothetical protein
MRVYTFSHTCQYRTPYLWAYVLSSCGVTVSCFPTFCLTYLFFVVLQTLSIISSENVFDLEFINEAARNMFTERLFLFVLFFLVHKSTANDGTDYEGMNVMNGGTFAAPSTGITVGGGSTGRDAVGDYI